MNTNNKREQKSAMKSNAKANKRVEDQMKNESAVSGSMVEAQMISYPAADHDQKVSSSQEEEKVPQGMMHPVPKRPTTSFFYFCQDNHAKLRESRYGNSQQPKINLVEIAQELGSRWQLLSDDDKKKYSEMYEKDKLRYKNQLQEIEDNGFFVMDDGKKSNQVLVPLPSKIANKKPVMKARSTQTNKDFLSAEVNAIVASKVKKIEQQFDRQVKLKVKETLLAKRNNAQRSKSATALLVKSEQNNEAPIVKAVTQKKPVNKSKTPQKSQSATKSVASQSQKVIKVGNKSRTRSKTPIKEQKKVVKNNQLQESQKKKRNPSKSLTKASQKAEAQSNKSVKVTHRSKQTKTRQQQHALAEAQ